MDTKAYVIGLIISCPLVDSESYCPFKCLREIPITNLLDVLNKIPNQEITENISHHRMCLQNRLDSRKAC